MAEQDFQKLLDIITRTSEQIATLEKRYASLQQTVQRKIDAKDLGGDQVRALQTQLTNLLATINQLKALQSSSQASLLNQQKLAEEARQLGAINKSIDTLMEKIGQLRRQQASVAGKGGAGFENDPAYYERQIKRLEAALASARSRAFRFTGAGNVDESRFAGVSTPQGGLESRLLSSPRYAGEVNKMGRDAAIRMLNQIQNAILEGAIAAKLQGNAAANAEANRLTNKLGYNDSYGNARTNQFLREEILRRKRLQDEATIAAGGQDALGKGPAYTIPTPEPQFANRYKQYEERISKNVGEGLGRLFRAIELEAQRQLTSAGLSGNAGGGFGRFNERITEAQRVQAFKAGQLPNFEQRLRDRQLGVADVSSATDRLKAQEEKLITTLRARIVAEEKYAQALAQAQKQGFTAGDLRRVQSRGTSGIEQLQFQRTDESGVQRRFDTYVSPTGRATPGISNQFRSFGQGIARDIGELTKWSIALAAIYGPMRKLQELTQIMIENQTKLAEATITVNSSFLGQAGIFNIAADAANKAGESIGGVIDAFTQAYRATGGAGDQVERLTIAQDLLNDSLILSKLSTLDQASAIDTLSAALRQSGAAIDSNNNPLQNGTELLDKWVRVTKIANVDMASLATGFAVLGDAAEAAQIDVDQLNGILAAIAESGVTSGRELANSARAIVAGFQSDQAREALESIGVAVEDTSGKMRPFLEIMRELSDLRKSGVIDDTAFSKLTLALGGGTRRQAVYATFIENLGRVGEIAAESAKANGDAQAALAKQLETVQTSLTNLGNAFQELAQTLGTEGGFLGIITQGVDNMTNLVKVFDSLTSVLGKATPAMAAFITASLALKYRGQGGIQQALLGVGSGLQRDPNLARLAQVSGSPLSGVPAQGFGRQFLQTNVLGTNAISGGLQGLLVAAIPAILNATNKEDRFGSTKAVANIIGGVGGGIVGSLVAGSPLIGAAVGTAISEAFINSTVARSTNIFGYKAPTLAEPGKEPGQTQDLDKALSEAEIAIYKSISEKYTGVESEALGRAITAGKTGSSQSLVESINKAIESRDKEAFDTLVNQKGAGGQARRDLLQLAGLSPSTLNSAFSNNQQIQFNPEFLAYNLASQQAQSGYDTARAARVAKGDVAGEATAFATMVEQNNTLYGALLDSIKESSKRDLSQRRVAGAVGGAEYGRQATAIADFDIKALTYYTALGDKVNALSDGADDAARQFEVLNNVIVQGTDEMIPQMTSLVTEISTLTNLLADPKGNAEELIKQFGGLEEAKDKAEELRETLLALIQDTNDQTLLKDFKFPEIVGDYNKPRTRQEEAQIYERGLKIQESYLDSTGATQEQIEAFKKAIEDFKVPIEDAGGVIFDTVSGLEQRFHSLAEAALTAEGALKTMDNFDIQQLDISSQQGAGLQGQINYFSKYLAQQFPQYQQNPEDVGVIFNDYVTTVLHGDNLAIKLALEKIVDINQKQLDGMYNIPEGATFWVPLTAAYYRPQNEGGAGGLPGLGEDANTRALDENTRALQELAIGFRGDLGYSREAQAKSLYGQPVTPGFPGDRGYSREAQSNREAALGYRGDLGFSRKVTSPIQQSGTGGESFLQQLQNFFRDLLARIPGAATAQTPGAGSGGRIFGGNAAGAYKGLSGQTSAQQVNPVVNARLDMRINNNTQLVVDGRVLASVITPYLASDLLRLEASQGTITKRVII